MRSVGERFIIESIMSLTNYSDRSIILALIDYKLNGLSGDQAAKKHGLHHRNTVYRADAQLKNIERRIFEIIPNLGFTVLYAKAVGDPGDPQVVTMDDQGKWSFIGVEGVHEQSSLVFFVKVGNRTVQL